MLLSRLVETSTEVAATRSRLAKRKALASCIAEAGPDNIELVVTFLSGTLRQRRTGVGWASLSGLPDPADRDETSDDGSHRPALTVHDVDDAFEAVAAMGGSGSAALRAAGVEALFARATAAEQAFLRGLVFEDLRQGALDSLVQDGLAAAFGVALPIVQRAAMLLGSTATAASRLVAGGVEALEAVGLQVGIPIRPMLAASAPNPEAAVPKSGLPALVDAKLDGIRIQVHRDGRTIRLYTPEPGRRHRADAGNHRGRRRAAVRPSGARRRGGGDRPGRADRSRSRSSRHAPGPVPMLRPDALGRRCLSSSSTCFTSTAATCWTNPCTSGPPP